MNATVVCQEGFSGELIRFCLDNNVWSEISGECSRSGVVALRLVRETCPGENYQDHDWPSTESLTSATIACGEGQSGFYIRPCLAGGVWDTVVTNNCSKELITELRHSVCELRYHRRAGRDVAGGSTW